MGNYEVGSSGECFNVINSLSTESQEKHICPFFGTWIKKVSAKEGPEKFSLENIRSTLKEKNMNGEIETRILNLLNEGGFKVA